jgi:hemerythrin
MSFLSWKEELSVNIAAVDEEHRILIDHLNKLYDAMTARSRKEVVLSALGDLIESSRRHFTHEEKIMSETGYPGYLAHIIEHETLTKRINELKEDVASGKRTVDLDVMHFLKEWLQSHILSKDMAISSYLHEQGRLSSQPQSSRLPPL